MSLRMLLVMLLVVITAGCATVKVDGNDAASSQADKSVVVEKAVEESSLDSRLLFNLLGGEIAGQRGDVALASKFYADAAEYSRDPEIALRATQIALYNNDIPAAKASVDILLEGGNVSAQTQRMALVVYLKSDDVEKSLEQIDSLLKGSDTPQRNTILAIGDIVSGNASKDVAISVIDAVVNSHSTEAGAYLSRSQIMMSLGELGRAKLDAEKTIQLDSSWSAGYVQLAHVLDKQGKRSDALAVLKEASERLKTRQLFMVYGQLLAKNEDYPNAKEQFLKTLEVDSDYSQARFTLALMHLKLEDVDQAIKSFEGLYKDNEFKSESAFYLGKIHYLQKDNEKALQWYSKVDGRSTGFIDAQINIAMIHAAAGDMQTTRVVFQRLRNRVPSQSPRFYLLEAELLSVYKQRNAAYQLMTEAVSENPNNLTLRYTRSIAATEVNQLAVAEQDLLFILEQKPNNVNALNALGYTLASKTFRFKEARQYLTRALELKPEDAAILDSMGWLNYREGNYEQALLLLQKAYKKVPDGEIAAHLGETLWALGRQPEAKKVWQEAIKRDAGNVHLLDVLKKYK